MYMIAEVSQYVAVASFAEAWIEIYNSESDMNVAYMSPPSRRRGLKYCCLLLLVTLHCRLLRGGVD